MEILSLYNVSKSYGPTKALDSISFSLEKSSVLGLLGPNGAGKTTLLRTITGIIRQDSGEIKVMDNSGNYGAMIGYLPEERGLYRQMNILDHLVFLGRIKDLSYTLAKKNSEYWLEKLGISDLKERKIHQLSKGQQQKVQFIAAVVHNPALVILDEPFSGLDPINADLLKTVLFEENQKGTTFILSTHRMESVEEFCTHVAFVNYGKLVQFGTVESIKQSFNGNIYLLTGNGSINPVPGIFSVVKGRKTKNGNEYQIMLETGKSINTALQYILSDFQIRSINEMTPDFNKIFLEIIKNRS